MYPLRAYSTAGDGIARNAGEAMLPTRFMSSRPARVVIGAAVFVVGMLAGAGIAAWLVPPV